MYGLSKVLTCAESEFRFCWIKLCKSDNQKTSTPKEDTTLKFLRQKKIKNLVIFTKMTLGALYDPHS